MKDVFLGLDTATPFLSLALWSPEGGRLAGFSARVEREHAARLIPELGRLFNQTGLEPQHLAGIGVGVGPGSYTGLRIGLATAQGLARGWAVPLAGGGSLAAIAAGALSPGETGVAALDARRGNVYAGVYRRGGEIEELEPPRKVPREALQSAYPQARWLEDLPPDATYLARVAVLGAPPVAVYL